jgi:hypothetical protein
MREYSSLGHVELVRDYEQNDKSSFLPASSCGYHGRAKNVQITIRI